MPDYITLASARRLRRLAHKELDLVDTCSIDRLGPSVQNLIGAPNGFLFKDMNIYIHKQRPHTGESAKKIVRGDRIEYQSIFEAEYTACPLLPNLTLYHH